MSWEKLKKKRFSSRAFGDERVQARAASRSCMRRSRRESRSRPSAARLASSRAMPRARRRPTAPRGTSPGRSAGASRRACVRRFRGRSRVLIRLAEVRTRVAGWEEPCHPGSCMRRHCNPLSPTMQPISHLSSHIDRRTSPRWPENPVATGRFGRLRALARAGRACKRRCSRRGLARTCRIAAVPSAAVPMLSRESRCWWPGRAERGRVVRPLAGASLQPAQRESGSRPMGRGRRRSASARRRQLEHEPGAAAPTAPRRAGRRGRRRSPRRSRRPRPREPARPRVGA